MGKARAFSDSSKDPVYQKESDDEIYSSAQQNSYNLGSTHFSDQSGIGNFTQAGTDQRKANIKGALFQGNVGFDLQTALLDIATNTIDLNNDSSGTALSLVSTDRFVTLSSGTTADLITITGAQRPGQRLRLYNTLTNTLVIKHTVAATVNTIRTPNASDLTILGDGVVDLTFDITTAQWRVVSGGGGAGTGTFVSAALSADQITNLAVGQHVEFDTNTPPLGADGLIVLQTGAGQADGIFELKQAKTYFLSGAVAPLFGAANHVEFVWYDITNATELGVRVVQDDAVLAIDQPKAEIIYTPATDVTVELRLVANTTPANLNGYDSEHTFGHIFEFSGKNGAPGADGTPGSTAWKAPARVATTAAGTLATDFENGDTIDGVTLVTGDRILIKDQATASENGIYTVNASGAPTRSLDADVDAEVIASLIIMIEEGTTNADLMWQLITNNPITVGVTNQTWTVYPTPIVTPGGGEDGKDASGTFILDGRQGIATDKLKKWERIDEVDLPDGILLKLLYLPFVVATVSPNLDEHGRLVALGLNNSAGGAQNISGSFSDNWGDTWTECIGLQTGFRYGLAAYDPVGDVVVTANTATGSTTAAHTIKKSLDRAVNFTATANSRTVSFTDLIWVAGSINLFILSVFNGGTTSIMTSPDGQTWTNRTTPTDFWTFLAYQEGTGTIFCFDNNANNWITSTDGTTWSSSNTATTPPASLFGANRVIWSEGQQQFSAVRSNGDFYSTPDGDVWTLDSTLPNVSNIRNLAWAADLSLWIAIGENSVSLANLPIFWWSLDRINWVQGPNSWRVSGNVRIGTTSNNADVVYVEEYGYFIGIGRANNQSTNITARCYRTEVEFNNEI